MHDQRTSTPAEQDAQIEEAILGLLLDSPALWSIQEVEREIGDQIAAIDALTRLARTGLVHRLDGFVFATRPAARAAVLNG